MSKHRFRFGPAELIFSLAALFFLGGLLALGFPQFYSTENRARILLISSLVLLSCFASLTFTRLYRKQKRARKLRQIITAWKAEKEAGAIHNPSLVGRLSQEDLDHLAARIYVHMGYRIYGPHYTDDLGCKIKLINPKGQLELLYCTQEDDPLPLGEITRFHEAMIREKAVCGYIWAPGGFSSEAVYWTKRKPIILADSTEIYRLVESTLLQE
jgi:hypothetical protein